MGIRFVVMVNKQGQTRVAQYYEHLSVDERRALEGEIVRKCLARTDQQVLVNPPIPDPPSDSSSFSWIQYCPARKLGLRIGGWGSGERKPPVLGSGSVQVLGCSFSSS